MGLPAQVGRGQWVPPPQRPVPGNAMARTKLGCAEFGTLGLQVLINALLRTLRRIFLCR